MRGLEGDYCVCSSSCRLSAVLGERAGPHVKRGTRTLSGAARRGQSKAQGSAVTMG